MASNRCSTVPTSTLYGSALVTDFVTRTVTSVTTLPDGSTTEVTSLDVDPEVQTQIVPTATLYATQCPNGGAVTSAASITTTRQATRTSLTRMTVEESSTQAGGSVVVKTVIRTISSAEVVVETQTLAPPPQASQDALTAGDGTQTHHTNAGAIAGGIVGAVVALALLATCLWFVRKRRRNAHATRNLDEFFSNPAAATVSGSGAAATAGGAVAANRVRRSGTLRSFSRQSMTVLDLEKEQQKSSGDNDENHWAALTRIDSAQLDDIVDDQDDDEDMAQRQDGAPPTYGRASSRQSMRTVSRPLSFHSMSMGHGLGGEETDAGGATTHGPIGSDAMYATGDVAAQQLLLRNDSDRSSASGVMPSEVRPINTRSFDMLPPSMFSSSPPPLSPTSPYSSPPLRDLPLQEGVAFDAAPGSPSSIAARANTDSGRPRIMRGSNLSMSSGSLLQHVSGSGGVPAHPASKPRSWSSSAFTVPDRPKSALGLSGGQQQQQQQRVSPFLAGMGMTPFDQSLQQSPPHSPPLGPSAPSSLRGRASLNGGSVPYMLPVHHNMRQQQQQRSPPLSPQQQYPPSASSPDGTTSAADYPPSQYAHLDAHKTEEERAEDRRHAFANASSASLRRLSSSHQQQRRHRSLSGDLLLRVTNAETSPPTTPRTSTARDANAAAAVAAAGDDNQKSKLSVRNSDESAS